MLFVPCFWLSAKLTANLPMMSKLINNASHAPAVHLLHGDNLLCAGIDRLLKDSVRVRNGQDHAHGPAAKRLRTEILMLRRLVTQPELRAVHGEPRYHASVRAIQAKSFKRSKGRFVKINGFRAIPHGKPGRNGALK
jgi:hypothetical protein